MPVPLPGWPAGSIRAGGRPGIATSPPPVPCSSSRRPPVGTNSLKGMHRETSTPCYRCGGRAQPGRCGAAGAGVYLQVLGIVVPLRVAGMAVVTSLRMSRRLGSRRRRAAGDGRHLGAFKRVTAAGIAVAELPGGGLVHINSSDTSAAAPGPSSYGRLLLIGGTEDRAGGAELLRTFAELSGGAHARIVLITTASGIPGRSFARFSAAFHRFGVPVVRELRLASREQADDERTLTELIWATGAFFGGGDQSRLGVLVGSRTNRVLRGRSADNELVIAGTSAGATAMGPAMILSGDGHAGDNDAVGSRVRTGPGLGLLPEVIVDMHFAERRRFPRLLAAVLRQPSHLGVGIDEDTAILVRPGRFDVLGRGAVMAVDARPAAATCPARGPADRACFDVRLHQLHAGDAFDMNRRRPPIAEPFRG